MIYVVLGDRDPRTDRVVRQLAGASEAADLDFVRLDGAEVDLEEIKSAAAAMPFMARQRRVIVQNAPIPRGKSDPLWTWLQEIAGSPPPALLLVIAFYLDGCGSSERTALEQRARSLEKLGVKVEVLRQLSRSRRDTTARSWVLEVCRGLGMEIEPSAVDFLISRTTLDGGAIEHEIAKVAAVKGFSGRITIADVEQADPHPAEQLIWDYLDAVVERHTGSALGILGAVFDQGEEPEFVLALLAGTVRRLILCKELLAGRTPPDELPRALGVPPWQAHKTAAQCARLDGKDLRRMLSSVVELDYLHKSGGLEYGGLERALDALTVRFCYREFGEPRGALSL